MAMAHKQTLMLCLSAWLVAGQRPSFAGLKPIGYPALTNVTEDPLGNRFGEEQLPVEAKGDRDLVNRLSKLPIDQQPFWYINWKAIEANNKNPQTYPQRENSFIDRNNGASRSNSPQNSNANINSASNMSPLTSKFGNSNGNSFARSHQYNRKNMGTKK